MRLFKERCYHGGKLHNFESRYEDKEVASPTQLTKLDRAARFAEVCEALRRLNTLEIYVHDVCTWCGTVVKR